MRFFKVQPHKNPAKPDGVPCAFLIPQARAITSCGAGDNCLEHEHQQDITYPWFHFSHCGPQIGWRNCLLGESPTEPYLAKPRLIPFRLFARRISCRFPCDHMNKYEVFLWARAPCVLISSAFFLPRSIVQIFIASQICISMEASSSFFSQAQEFILV